MDNAVLPESRGGASLPCLIHSLAVGPLKNLVYLIEDPSSNRAAVVDPAWDVDRIARLIEMRDLDLTDILLTHGHDDHANGLTELLSWFAPRVPRVHVAAEEATFWRQVTSGQIPLHSADDRTSEVWGAAPPADLTTHGDSARIALGTTGIEMIQTPGHSPGGACYRFDRYLITGDTLFVYGCGRCDLDGSDPRLMFHSLQRLQHLIPDDVIILPGHHYASQPTTTMAEQRRANPFLHFHDPDGFVAFRAEHNEHRLPPYGPVPKGASAW
jgi:hydroxyacylglutathione hydrolase